MKVEIEIADEIMEMVETFRSRAESGMNSPMAKLIGLNAEKVNTQTAINILLMAGLEKFSSKGKEETTRFDDEDDDGDEDESSSKRATVGFMSIGPNGVSIEGDIPEEVRAALEAVGESFQEVLSSSQEDCDCPKCQMRKAHTVKGKVS